MTADDVLNGDAKWSCEAADALVFLRGLPNRAVDLVVTSPPYTRQRTYGIGCNLTGQAWVDWLRPIIREACRVSKGLVCVNAAGPVEDRAYSPVMEWLVSDLTRLDGVVCGPAPWCWWKVCGIPGSGSDCYQRRDWEPVYSFCLSDRLPLAWSDNTAFGHPPKKPPGGAFSNRDAKGTRADDLRAGRAKKKTIRPDGCRMETMKYSPPDISNPGNVIRTDPASDVIEARVGGGHLGHPLAHDGEAPYPVELVERFVCWYCPPGGVVCDPFSGSGTTAHAAVMHGRRFVGGDLRPCQVELCRRRMTTVTPNLF